MKNLRENMIEWECFSKIDVRVGTIIEIIDFPEAKKPAFKLRIDFGEEIGIKQSSAQITEKYTKTDLFEKQVIGVVNFKPKQIGKFMSECLVLGIYDTNNDVILLKPDQKVENGRKIG